MKVVVTAVVIILLGILAATAPQDNEESPAAVDPDTSTTEAPATSAPTTGPPTTAAPTTAPPPVEPVILEGVGDSIVQLPNADPVTASISHTGSRNFVVTALDSNLVNVDLLVNEIGGYIGTVPINFRDGENATNLEVTADGAWRIELRPITDLAPQPGPLTGAGDSVVRYSGHTAPAAVAHDGDSNFVVHALSLNDGSADLVINEIGNYTGTVRLVGPSVIIVTANGGWSITPQ